mmetsp:Transcript_7152/g.10457  ORF Transcript_7152/g.10457 Transcript_7152/m.10457 type:complete len:84 (+) Transcript_7152:821-1072(+)
MIIKRGTFDDANDHKSSDKAPLIAVFDANHTYGGAYLVPTRRLYESVNAKSMSTGKSESGSLHFEDVDRDIFLKPWIHSGTSE